MCDALVEADRNLRSCVTTTTRPTRDGEVDGRDYHFTTEDGFQKLLDAGEMVEWADVHGHRYGTTLDSVNAAVAGGCVMLLDIDVQGAETWKRFLGERCVLVFVVPPSLDELKTRLEQRRTEDKAALELRMKTARTELTRVGEYDYVVVNSDLPQAVSELQAILMAERRRPGRMKEGMKRLQIEI
jgi:guanylate kinase